MQAQISSLQGKVDKVGQQYDAAGQQLSTAKAQLAQVTKQSDNGAAGVQPGSATLAAVAVAQYENSGDTSIIGLLTSGNPDAVLGEASLVLQVENTHNEEAQQLLTMAQELSTIKAQRQHTEQGVAQLEGPVRRAEEVDDDATRQADVPAQQPHLGAAGRGGIARGRRHKHRGDHNGRCLHRPDRQPVRQAVAFAYAQLGKSYVYGATGPDSYDCSGLVQAAWASAGVSIPRTTYEQWASLPHIPTVRPRAR